MLLAVFGTLLVAGSIGAFAPMTHQMDGTRYSLPADHDFTVQVCGLARWFGCPSDREPDSLSLVFSSRELEEAIPGYQAVTRGYVPNVAVDLIVLVNGGRKASEFGIDYQRIREQVLQARRDGAPILRDRSTNWQRVVWLNGDEGTPGAGHSNFYLLPQDEQHPLAKDWIPPSCLGSPDQNRVEYYRCNFWIRHEGKTFQFSLPEENLEYADRIPAYVLERLEEWHVD